MNNLVHCHECGHEGEAITNNRNQKRCAFCYALNVTPIEPKPEPQPAKQERKPTPKGKGA